MSNEICIGKEAGNKLCNGELILRGIVIPEISMESQVNFNYGEI